MIYDLTLPTTWNELSDGQLLYVLKLTAAAFTPDEIAARLVIHSIPRKLRHRIPTERLAVAAQVFAFLKTPPTRPVRPAKLAGAAALAPTLQGTTFADYLMIENLWQGFLFFSDVAAGLDINAFAEAGATDAATALLGKLYPNYKRRRFEPWHAVAAIVWLQGLKTLLSETFAHLFQPSTNTAPPDMREQMEMQIRALTGGDITKREEVLQSETWAALTELDAKAAEADELNSKLKK